MRSRLSPGGIAPATASYPQRRASRSTITRTCTPHHMLCLCLCIRVALMWLIHIYHAASVSRDASQETKCSCEDDMAAHAHLTSNRSEGCRHAAGRAPPDTAVDKGTAATIAAASTPPPLNKIAKHKSTLSDAFMRVRALHLQAKLVLRVFAPQEQSLEDLRHVLLQDIHRQAHCTYLNRALQNY